MILDKVEFEQVISRLGEIFLRYFDSSTVAAIMEQAERLCWANFECYQANMQILKIRKNNLEDYKAIAENEWIARSVGEKRVFAKIEINKILANTSTTGTEKTTSLIWDDVVYSVGEMVDRIIIEHIKIGIISIPPFEIMLKIDIDSINSSTAF